MASLLITGTDTDVGKTWVTISLAAYWQKYCFHHAFPLGGRNLNNSSTSAQDKAHSLGIFKLLQTGVGDKELYDRLFGTEPLIEVASPVCFTAPIAPPVAAAKEGKIIDLGRIWQAFQALEAENFVLLEGLGGLGSPVTTELTVADIASEWRLPTVLVVPVKLGAIAHTVANVALARSLNLDLKGIILSCGTAEASARIEDLTPADLIESLTQTQILGILPYIGDIENFEKLAQIVSNWDVEIILPRKVFSS